jgi:hypothetical protein
LREQKVVGNVSKDDAIFNEKDSYYLFANVMGIDVSSVAHIPTSTVTNLIWHTGLLDQNWLNGTPKHKVVVTSNNQVVNMVYAWPGDLNWSHSTDPAVVAQTIASNSSAKTTPKYLGTYASKTLETANLSVSSKLENGKVVLTTTLTKEGLAGLELIMNYDQTRLTLDNVTFDTGPTMTNFSTHDNGRLTFGSIDQLKTARIKTGTPYKVTFTPKTTLTNTAGLFFFVLSDAVDGGGNTIKLIVE